MNRVQVGCLRTDIFQDRHDLENPLNLGSDFNRLAEETELPFSALHSPDLYVDKSGQLLFLVCIVLGSEKSWCPRRFGSQKSLKIDERSDLSDLGKWQSLETPSRTRLELVSTALIGTRDPMGHNILFAHAQ